VIDSPVFPFQNGVSRAGLLAGKAADAPFPVKGDLACGLMRFRILAPEAPEGAPFEKQGSSNPRSVMDGKTLNVKQQGTG